MSIFREIPTTAGMPVYALDFFKSSAPGSLEEDLQNFLGLRHLQVTYSGTAAFYLILETLKELSSKKTVILPAFICPSLVFAVLRAGLKPGFCDVREDRFDYDVAELEKRCDDGDVLSVVAVHLAGIPADLEAAQKITKSRDIFLIEDCAQSLGAEYDGKKVGTFGDFSFFSLKRGKGLTIYEGGILATRREDCAEALEKTWRHLTREEPLSETLKILELIGYGGFYRPFWFWWVFKLPENFWNFFGNKVRAMGEHFSVDFPTHRVSHFRKAVGHACFRRLLPAIEEQRKKALHYFEALDGQGAFRMLRELPGSWATYPFVTLVFPSREKRDAALDVLDRLGLGASVIYVHAITDYEYLKPMLPQKEYPNARRLAGCVLTLSTSAYLSKKDVAVMTRAFFDKIIG